MSNKLTISSIFMVPTLKIDKDKLKDHNFINGFIGDKTGPSYEDSVYLLFKPKDLYKFQIFIDEEYERKDSNIIEDYDYDGGYVVLIYKLNKKYNRDFELVKKGKYSKTSQEFQNLFSKVKKVIKNGLHKDEISLQYRIFNKSDDLRVYWEDRIGKDFTPDMEIWEGFDEYNEIFDIERYKQLV